MLDRSSSNPLVLAPVLVLLQGVFYGLGDAISKPAFAVMPIYSLLAIRYLLALGLLLVFAGKRVRAGLRQCSPRDWLAPALCIAAAHLTGNAALEYTTATSTAFLRSLSTVMTPLLALVLFRRRFGWKHVPIQLLAIGGLYLLCGRGGLSGFGAGEALALLTALLLALSLVLGQSALGKMDAVTLSTVQCGMSALMGTVCALTLNGGFHTERLTGPVLGVIVYLAVACTIGGYLLQNLALERISDRTVALLQCFCPVMTALFSRFILSERLSAAGVAGALLLLLCVAGETLLRDEAAPMALAPSEPDPAKPDPRNEVNNRKD